MFKIRRSRDFQHVLLSSPQEEQFNKLHDRFLCSGLGKIYRAVPWDEMAWALGLAEAEMGPRPIFSPRCKVAGMFLMHYVGCSDRKLVEGLNGKPDRHFFQSIYLGAERLVNHKIGSVVRCELEAKLDMGTVQKALYGNWSAYIDGRPATDMDATC
ncbi:hypothetical protein [Maribacter sp. 2307ULW6-5]|uniref:hypothetical protein n=1 Tax=Maribacter sp. 2307ULW6-5 TaxID=3386275 RepID=UPI0039BC4CDC